MQNRYYMKDEVPFSEFPGFAEKPSRGGSKALTILFVTSVIIAAIVGGLYFLGRTQNSGSTATVTPTATQAPTEAPSPSASVSATLTPSPSAQAVLDRSKVSVSVLNGSGVRGAANTTAATLRNLGYIVGATGNANRFNYVGITILVKSTRRDYAEQLKKDLNAPDAAVTTDDTIAPDAVVIIGR